MLPCAHPQALPCLVLGLWLCLKPSSTPGVFCVPGAPWGPAGRRRIQHSSDLQTPWGSTLSPLGAAGARPPLQPSRAPMEPPVTPVRSGPWEGSSTGNQIGQEESKREQPGNFNLIKYTLRLKVILPGGVFFLPLTLLQPPCTRDRLHKDLSSASGRSEISLNPPGCWI